MSVVAKTACLVCGRTEVEVQTWNHDRTELNSTKVYPVPADYPYCWTCHYSGEGRAHASADLVSGIREVTGTEVEIWHTGGGTMSGVVKLTDCDGWDCPFAYFGIVHDDNTVELAGYLGLSLWREDGHFQMTQHEMWFSPGSEFDWLGELEKLWGDACDSIGWDDAVSNAKVVEWFRMVWGDTVRILEANRDEWLDDESRLVWNGKVGAL